MSDQDDEHTVVVTLHNKVVRLIFDGDEKNAVAYGADEKLASQEELKNVQNSEGKEPRGENMRALLTCHGGTLQYDNDGVTYKIIVNKEPDQLEEKIDYIFGRMKKAEDDEKTLQLSKPSVLGYSSAMSKIGVRFDAPEWDRDENTEKLCRELSMSMSHFRWKQGEEDSTENRSLYMAYLRNKANIVLPVKGKLFDGAEGGDFLSVDMISMGVKTKGNIDVVMAAERHQKVHTTTRNMWAGIELKRQDNNKNSEIRRQVVLQHLSASYLNENTGILTIMTDLGSRWHFYWFSKGQNALMEYEATSKGEASYLIRHMKDTGATSAPTDFLNRASWNQMFPPPSDAIMDEAVGEKRGHDVGGDHGDEGRHDSSGTSYASQKKRSRSSTGGPLKTRQSRSSGGGSGVGGTAHATTLSLDFMDEEEEKEARFRDVLECILPQLGLFPPQGLQQDHHAEGPPSDIGGS